MANIVWRDGYSVGIPSFDDDHKKIIELINRLHLALRDHEENDGMLKIALDEVVEYGQLHFRHEESIMAEHKYPGLEQHEREHRLYNGQVDEFVRQLEQDSSSLAMKDLYHFLRKWWTGHISEVDMEYGPYLKGRGVQ